MKTRNARGNLSALIGKRPPSKTFAHKLLHEHGFREPARVHAAITRLYTDQFQRGSLAKIFPRLIHLCEQSVDPDRVLVNFERLVSALPNPSMFYHYLQAAPDRLDLLTRVFAHSQALADTLTRNAEHFHFLIAPETLKMPREKAWLAAELNRLLMAGRGPAQRYDIVRRFRRRETLRIGARDLIGLATVEETTLELSNLADVCLQAVFEIALEKVSVQYKIAGAPFQVRPGHNRAQKGAPTHTESFTIIGMGKLG